MRENRAKESKEAKAERKMKDNEATKEALANETEEENQLRLAKNRKYKEDRDKNETDEQKKERNARESAQRKARRHAAKLANSEFQRVQTVPRALEVSKSLSQKDGLPRRHDGTPSPGSGLPDEDSSMSDYEKLRLQNIQEIQQKFQKQFGTIDPLGPGPSLSRKRNMPQVSPESSDDDFISNAKPVSRRQMPKRSCTAKNYECIDSESSNSLDELVDKLVDEAVDTITDSESYLIVTNILETLLETVLPKRHYLRGKKGQPNIGRRTKNAQNFQRHWDNLDESEKKAKLDESTRSMRKYRKDDRSKIAREHGAQMQAMYRQKESKTKKIQRQSQDAKRHENSRAKETSRAKNKRLLQNLDYQYTLRLHMC